MQTCNLNSHRLTLNDERKKYKLVEMLTSCVKKCICELRHTRDWNCTVKGDH